PARICLTAPVLDWAKIWPKSAPARNNKPTVLRGSVSQLLFWTGPRAGPNPLLLGITSQWSCSDLSHSCSPTCSYLYGHMLI
ncbi:hypothetical protein A2U01_0085518, partial [Trifolium medium]|nr:hypothetical protein [Trifolium medium]